MYNQTKEKAYTINPVQDKWNEIKQISLGKESRLVMVARLKTGSMIALKHFTCKYILIQMHIHILYFNI